MRIKCGQVPDFVRSPDNTLKLKCPCRYEEGICTHKRTEHSHKLTFECFVMEEASSK